MISCEFAFHFDEIFSIIVKQLFVVIFVTVYHDACIENLLLRLILFIFRIKLKASLLQMSDFTLSPPYLGSNFMSCPPP